MEHTQDWEKAGDNFWDDDKISGYSQALLEIAEGKRPLEEWNGQMDALLKRGEHLLRFQTSRLLAQQERGLREKVLGLIQEHKEKGFDPATTLMNVRAMLALLDTPK
jgi:hypothetical protein